MIRSKLSTVLSLLMGTMIVLSTGTVFGIAIYMAVENTRTTLAEKLTDMLDGAVAESRNHFQPMERLGRVIAKQIVGGMLALENRDQLQLILSGAVTNLPQVEAITIQYRDGTGLYFDRIKGELSKVEWRPEWRAPLDTFKPEGLWVVRPSAVTGVTTSAFLVPARGADGDIAVVEIRSDVRRLSQNLAQAAPFRGFPVTRFILLNKNRVFAHPSLAETPPGPATPIDKIDDTYLQELYTGMRYEPSLVGPVAGAEIFVLETERQTQRVMVLMEDKVRQSGADVIIGVHIDPAAGETEVRPLLNLLWIGAALLVFFILVAIYVGKRASKPINRLADAASLVQQERLDEVPVLAPSRVLELSSATQAFNAMVDGLKERRRIRDLFGKYVPEHVAAMLTSSDDVAKPTSTVGTILFLDIAGFTQLSETLPPEDVVETLNAFFSDAVAIVEAENGMITQFQGDAILAVFNVPLASPDHATRAVKASLAILKAVKDNAYCGHKLTCRIGINTGPVVAGAIGAEGRLSYTVYGDAVNVSSRLEQANKDLGTVLLISEATKKLVETIDMKAVTKLAIRGRQEPVDVYTIAS